MPARAQLVFGMSQHLRSRPQIQLTFIIVGREVDSLLEVGSLDGGILNRGSESRLVYVLGGWIVDCNDWR